MTQCLLTFHAESASSLGMRLFIDTLDAEGWSIVEGSDSMVWVQLFNKHLSPSAIERRLRDSIDLAVWVSEINVVEFTIQIGGNPTERKKLSTQKNGARAIHAATLH
jgi:hypothetical protein